MFEPSLFSPSPAQTGELKTQGSLSHQLSSKGSFPRRCRLSALLILPSYLLLRLSSSWRHLIGKDSFLLPSSHWTERDSLPRGVTPLKISSVQSLSRVRLFATPWTAARQASLTITSSQSLLRLRSTELVMLPNRLILCHPLLLLPSIFPSIRVFSKEPVLHIRWPKYFSFSLRINPSREYSGLISFRIDWLDLLAVQGTLKSLCQCHNSKISVLWHSPFFIV